MWAWFLKISARFARGYVRKPPSTNPGYAPDLELLAKRILKLPQWYSNTAACIALGWHSIHSICTIRKLKYLSKIAANENTIAYRAFSSRVDDVESLGIVNESREFELKGR